MDGRSGLALVCAVAGGAWALLVLAVLVGRLRAGRRRLELQPEGDAEWRVPKEALERFSLEETAGAEEETRIVLLRALRCAEPELRLASITALGRLGGRHDWAVDCLIEALADELDSPVRVAGQLDRLTPRPGARLLPLLEHPSSIVRFYAVRLLSRYGSLAARRVPRLTCDRSPNVRAAALETLRAVASGEALRCALRLLEDPHPLVRAHAGRTAAGIAPLAAAPFLVPLLADGSWWVRDAAREALVAAGPDVAAHLESALKGDDAVLRREAALVLQDVGVVDELAGGDRDGRLERILDAGGGRLRLAADERARSGQRLVAAQLAAEAAS